MKKLFVLLIMQLISYSAWSQTMNIHYKNGQTVEYNMDNIDYLEFTEKKESNVQVSSEKAVDLGLSVKWASCNVGATSPEQFGDKYAWGETKTKDVFSKDNYIYLDVETKVYTYLGKDISGTEYDAAKKQWGGKWRMPTFDEMKELRTKCEFEWARFNNGNGFKVIGPNGNSIFIPVEEKTGYWSSTLSDFNTGSNSDAFTINFNYSISPKNYGTTSALREYGFYIRPVISE